MSMWADRARRPRGQTGDVAFTAAVVFAGATSVVLFAFVLFSFAGR
jgi:hypothetical protein